MIIKTVKLKNIIYYALCAVIIVLFVYLLFLVFLGGKMDADKHKKQFVGAEGYTYVLYETKPRKKADDGFFKSVSIKFEDIVSRVLPNTEKHGGKEGDDKVVAETEPKVPEVINEVVLEEQFIPTFQNVRSLTTMQDLIKNIYTIDRAAYVTINDLDIDTLVGMNLKADLHSKQPKVLIFHTHSQETFKDSREGVEDDTIVGIGRTLSEILVNEYNISVVHDKGQYDVVNGRGASYEVMEPYVRKILEKYPSIEVCIDLHRDGVGDDVHLVKEVDGAPCARIMYFNGMTRLNKDGAPEPLTDLQNPYLRDNLALSLQMQLKTNELYPGLARKIYIKPYRYSLHFRPKSLLIEVGANTNTVQEERNTMPLLAKVLHDVLDTE